MSNRKKRALIEEVGVAMRMHQNAVDEVDEAASEYVGMNRTDMRCVDIVERRGRLTAGELATEMGLTTGAVTGMLDRLEKRGMVRRVRDAKDRRRVLVEPADLRAAWAVYGPIKESSDPALARYSQTDLALIRDFLVEGRELLMKHAERIRAMARREASRRKRR